MKKSLHQLSIGMLGGIILLLLSSNYSYAQISRGGTPKSVSQKVSSDKVPTMKMGAIDLVKIQEEDKETDKTTGPWRFAIPFPVNYSLNNSGSWSALPNGDRIWRLNIHCPDAKNINLLYSDFYMPKDALLYLYNKDRTEVIGAFGAHNNNPTNQFATAIINDDFITVEYYEPASAKNKGRLTISQVGHGYRGFDIDNQEKGLNDSGACQVNVNCSPEGDDWQDEKKGVCRLTNNGSSFCSGSLVNNTAGDCTPYMLTADHCIGSLDAVNNPNAPTWVLYWNYERAGCDNTGAVADQTTTGATCVANDVPSDFALFLLTENPNDVYDVYFNGFNATSTVGSGGVGIHHPSGDAKKIATHSLVPTMAPWGGGPSDHWRVLPWDATPNGQSVTEGGSSGSPLFDNNSRIIGQLHGGSSINCSNPSADPGVYGGMWVSWDNNGATIPQRRIRDWLDPVGGGATTTLDGAYNPCQMMTNNDECINADPIACGDVLSGSTTGMNADVAPFCVTGDGTGGGVWYEFAGNGDDIVISTCSANTNYDAKIRVFTGTCGALVCETGNDDDATCGSSSLHSTVDFSSVMGTTYYILVHGAGANEGDFELSLNCTTPPPPPPANDECAGAISMACNQSVVGSTVGAGVDNVLTCDTDDGTGGGLWYSFVGDGSSYTLSTCNAFTNFNTRIRVYEGSCASLSCVAGNDDDATCGAGSLKSSVEFLSVASTTYYVLIHGSGSSEGNFQLDLFCGSMPTLNVTCPNDLSLGCGATVPDAATTQAGFMDQGGIISGGGAAATYSVSSSDVIEGNDCKGYKIIRTYTIIDNFSGSSGTCDQEILVAGPGSPTIVCPMDLTVSCEDEINLDPNDAVVTVDCGLGYVVYIRNPTQTGAPGCNGTVYNYEYVVVDDCGNTAVCSQMVTVVNTPASINVPVGGLVDCFEDINIGLNDASVSGSCANYNLFLVSPVVNGEQGCPGATYTYTYRLIDDCGNVIEEDVVFTNGDNAGPSIQAPMDATYNCLGAVKPDPDNATVSTSCTIGSTVTVSGPQIFGPMDCPGTVYRYTYTVTDACGRTASDVQDITVNNGPPVFSGCEEDQWLQFNCEDYGGEDGTIAAIEAYIASVTAYSSCGVQLSVINNFNPNNINTCINNGINTITFRATDNCGRTTLCTTTYVVVDTEAPTIYEQAQDHWELCNFNTQSNLNAWVASQGGAAAYDGCSNENVFWSTIPANPTINCNGASGTTSVTVTFVVRDNCNNSTSTTATFNALPNTNNVQGDQPKNRITLNQNRPNPFKSETLIGFNLPAAASATLTFYDINGRLLKEVQADYNQGYNEVSISRSELGTTGMVYYRLMTDEESITKTMLVID